MRKENQLTPTPRCWNYPTKGFKTTIKNMTRQAITKSPEINENWKKKIQQRSYKRNQT